MDSDVTEASDGVENMEIEEEEEEDDDDECPRTPDQSLHRMAQDPDRAWQELRPRQVFQAVPTAPSSKRQKDCTRIVCMSDTHATHRQISVPKGDVLIHGGDFTKSGEPGTVRDLSQYFAKVGMDNTIVIAGNHDLTFQPDFYATAWRRFHHKQAFDAKQTKALLTNCIYLEDTSHVLEGDMKVYGSPWQPVFYDWAFNLQRGEPLRAVWSAIPADTDILVTHGPPLGRGDLCSHGKVVGCFDLLQEVQDRVKPRVHVFGHVHESYGTSYDGTTLYVNASNLTHQYLPLHHCLVIDVPHDKNQPAMLVKPQCPIQDHASLLNWFQERGFNRLHDAMKSLPDVSNVPLGNDLLAGEVALHAVCDGLGVQRDPDARKQVVMALSMLYAESFE